MTDGTHVQVQEVRQTYGDRVAYGSAAVYQAYQILYATFIVIPILVGMDKFFYFLTTWDKYLAPIIPRLLLVEPHTIVLGIGMVEIIAGIVTALRPRLGGYIVAVWLWGIIVNLFLIPGYFDIALRDLGLSFAALALARLSSEFD